VPGGALPAGDAVPGDGAMCSGGLADAMDDVWVAARTTSAGNAPATPVPRATAKGNMLAMTIRADTRR
jgi:hypothetical protein